MRKGWTDHVAETRRKGNRGKKTMSHREAMKAASVTWPKIKKRLLKKQQKEKSAAKRVKQSTDERPDENDET